MHTTKSDRIKIEELAEMLGCSVSTVRQERNRRNIPQPIKRKSTNETMYWLRADIEKHLKIGDYAPTKPAPVNIEDALTQSIRLLVQQEIRNALLEESAYFRR